MIGSSLVCFLLFLLSCFPAFLLSGFPAFLLSCFPAFLLFCFPSFRLSCFPAFPIFDIDTRLCKALCPHPGEMVYLTYLMFLLFFMIFPAFLFSCLSAFLLFYFLTVLLRCAFASVCLCFCVCLSLLCCACTFVFSLSRGVAYLAYSRLLRSCSVFSLPARRRPTSLRLVDGFVGQGVGSLVVLSVDISYFPFDFIFSESVP